jgi:hypothetical protein
MTPVVRSVEASPSRGQGLVGAKGFHRGALLAVLLVGAAIVFAGYNWRSTTGQTIGGDLPDSPGVDRQVDGLHVLDAYLVPRPAPGSFSLVCDLVTRSGGPDRLVAVSLGDGAAAGLGPVAGGNATAATGLSVPSDHLLQIGPEANATPVTVTGVSKPPGPGSLATATFSFARRGPVSMRLPIWASVSGPAGRDHSGRTP